MYRTLKVTITLGAAVAVLAVSGASLSGVANAAAQPHEGKRRGDGRLGAHVRG